MIERLLQARREWGWGRFFGYPRCCVASFCLAHVLGVRGMAIRAGVVQRRDGSAYVPCAVHRGRAPGWKPYGPGFIKWGRA